MNSRATPVAIALGSNLGDRDAHFDYALSRLAQYLTQIRASTRRVTAPVGVVGEQPAYLNAAVTGDTLLSARELLDRLQAIERERGRERPYVNAPRTLDLDLVLYGDAVISEGALIVPHPRFRQRAFVLEPLAEIAPHMVDPVTNLTVRVLLDRLHR